MSPNRAVEDAWKLTRAICPRDRVRVAAVDASGLVLNQYSRTWPTDRQRPPTAPWAVPLASPDGFRLLVFDLDAKGSDSVATADSVTLAELLTEAGIAYVICKSGPSGGRHIWTAASEEVDPDLVGTVARLASSLLPSLDIAPLRNSATGCVRPPGAPHRDGGQSEVLEGDLEVLLQPTTDVTAIQHLVRLLASRVTGQPDVHSPTLQTIRTDERGHPYLPGARRPLPSASQTALEASAADLDASAVLNTVLLGAAANHWHLTDIAELASTAPGLEHLRSKRGTNNRTPRRPRDQAETLARQWRYAVQFVAEHPRRTGSDATFDTRAGQLADTVRVLQEHADAAQGRWNHGGGPSDRRVLDCLHLWALTAVSTVLEADVRRIALACGIGRETARTALQRLANDRWITQVKEAAGVHGASWQIDPQGVVPSSEKESRSQAATRPEGAGAAERTLLLQQLQRRLDLESHDIFTGNTALPLAAGNLYARLATTPSTSTSSSTDFDERLLQRLASLHLARPVGTGWVAAEPLQRDIAAFESDVEGRLIEREARYRAERTAWSWWHAEHTWMCEARPRRDHRPRPDQAPLWQPAGPRRYPKHPRGPDGRADFSAARNVVNAGAFKPDAVFLVA